MEYRELGKTNINASRIGFGGAAVGNFDYLERFDPTSADTRGRLIETILRAVELGINYFDTAPAYGRGEGEKVFGEAFRSVSQPIHVASKISLETPTVRASVEGSLERLGRDSIDLLQLHGTSMTDEQVDLVIESGGLLDQMVALREEGLVGHIGFTSEDNNAAVFRLIESGVFETVQLNFNLLFQHPADWTHPFGSMVEADERGMGIITMRALTAGVFQRWVQVVNPENQFDYTASLLQYVLSNPLVDVVLVGMRTPEMVEANVRTADDTAGRIDLHGLHAKFVL